MVGIPTIKTWTVIASSKARCLSSLFYFAIVKENELLIPSLRLVRLIVVKRAN